MSAGDPGFELAVGSGSDRSGDEVGLGGELEGGLEDGGDDDGGDDDGGEEDGGEEDGGEEDGGEEDGGEEDGGEEDGGEEDGGEEDGGEEDGGDAGGGGGDELGDWHALRMSSRITIDALASFCVCFLMMSVKLLLYHAVDQKK